MKRSLLWPRPLAALFGCALAFSLPSSASAETYQNDGFVDNTAVGFQAGFAVGEVAAACFTPPESDYPIRLRAIQLLYGGDRDGATIFNTMKVWGSGGDGQAPGNILVSEPDVELISSTTELNEFDLTSYDITVTGSFCVGVEFANNSGLPSVARDDDGTIDAGNNWIFAVDPLSGDPLGWFQSDFFGLTGDWIIRAIGDPVSGGGGSDAGGGVRPDAGGGNDAGGGGSDAGGGGNDAGGGGNDAGAAIENPDIFDVDQEGNLPTEDIKVIIEGRNLRSEFRYSVEGESLSAVTVNGDGSEVEGVWSADDIPGPGEYDVEIIGDFPAGQVTDRGAITIIEPPLGEPAVTALSPDSSFIGVDEAVIISGANFQEPITVTLCGRPLVPVTVISETQLQVVIPGDLVDSPGTCDLFVQTDSGSVLSRSVYAFNSAGGGGGGCAHAPTPSRGFGLSVLLLAALAGRRRRAL